MIRLRYAAYITILFLQVAGCSSGSPNQTQKISKDSTYVAPLPGKLSDAEYNRLSKAVASFYDSFLLRRGFNGSILVAKKGQIIFEDYHGFGNIQKRDSLNEHSAFHLASVSKTFTAMATLKLAEQGKLKLDDNIKLYFPTLPYEGITIKMLLSHRSGLPNYLYFLQKLGWDVKKFSTNTDVLNYLVTYKPALTSTPGTHFSYCNTNFALLGLIIEKASGTSYSDYLQKTIFTPLQMNDTYVFNMSKDSLRAMPSYNWRGRQEGYTFLDVGFGDKNIYSTPRDLLKWDQALYNNQLFSKQTLDIAFTPYSNEKAGTRNYGYGWRMNLYPNGRKIIYHNGWWHGNNTVLMRLIQDSVTIIILGNKYNRAIYDAKKMVNIFQPYFITDEEDKGDNLKEADSMTNLNKPTLVKRSRRKASHKKKYHRKR